VTRNFVLKTYKYPDLYALVLIFGRTAQGAGPLQYPDASRLTAQPDQGSLQQPLKARGGMISEQSMAFCAKSAHRDFSNDSQTNAFAT
jgi:hypothetical protein